MSHTFQVGDMVKVKQTHINGDGHEYPNLSVDFDIRGYNDPDNCFKIVEIMRHQCGGDWAECRKRHGCTGPMQVERITSGRTAGNPRCLGFTKGFAFELAEPPEILEEWAKLGIERNSGNERIER